MSGMSLDDCEYIFDSALSSTTEAAFCHAIDPLFKQYQILSIGFGRANIFWRARIVNETLFTNLSDMNYPPSHIARVGRLNDSGSPCLYVSARKETAIAEVGAKEGQIVQLAGFRVLGGKELRLALIGEYSNVQKNGYMHYAGGDPNGVLTKFLNSIPRSEALKKIYIDKFFANVLGDPNACATNYLMSRAMAQSIYARNESDGIVFPSVKDRGGFNIGIKPSASDESIHNVCCIIVKLERQRRFGLLDFEMVKSAKNLDSEGYFVWDDSLIEDGFGLYGLNKEEHEIATRFPDDRNALLNVIHRS